MIRTLDDIVLIPTPVRTVTMTRNGEVGKTREELRAQLFTELVGQAGDGGRRQHRRRSIQPGCRAFSRHDWATAGRRLVAVAALAEPA